MHQILVPDVPDVGVFEGSFDLDFDALGYADTPQLREIITEIINGHDSDEPTSPDLSCESPKHQTNDRLPRHRRNSHVRAEKKRRKKINEQLQKLQEWVPALRPRGNSKKLGELECLEEAGKHIKERKHRCESRLAEIDQLKKEKEAIKRELNQFQAALPTSGLKRKANPVQSIAERYEEHRNRKFSEQWEFGLFDHTVGSNLAETYIQHTGHNTSPTVYIQSLMKWTESCLSLTHLRPVVISGLRDLGTNTSFLTKPGKVKQELANSMRRTHPAPSATATTSTVSHTEDLTSLARTVTTACPEVIITTTPNPVKAADNTLTESSTSTTTVPTTPASYILLTTAENTTSVKLTTVTASKSAVS